MKLFKNVDICDIASILDRGVISIDELEKSNWMDGKRANNPTDIVYLFSPNNIGDSFPQYGVALLEIETDNVKENVIGKNDFNYGKYKEFIAKNISPNDIKKIYIPLSFKNHISISEDILNEISWCQITADHYGENELEKCSDEIIERFAMTANLEDSSSFNFFRGVTEKRTMIDLYNVKYSVEE